MKNDAAEPVVYKDFLVRKFCMKTRELTGLMHPLKLKVIHTCIHTCTLSYLNGIPFLGEYPKLLIDMSCGTIFKGNKIWNIY